RIFDAVRDGDATGLAEQMRLLQTKYESLGHVYSNFLANHDQPRTRTLLGGDLDKCKLAATLQFTQPGTPFIYYGEELGMTGDKPDPEIRTPMPWTTEQGTAGFTTARPWKALNDNPAEVSVQAQTDDDASLLSHYRGLIRLRQTEPALRSDAAQVVDTGDSRVIAYFRGTGTDRLLVVANVSEEAIVTPGNRAMGSEVLLGELPEDGRMSGLSAVVIRWPDRNAGE
ncbi:MAG: alpha-amylase family glycosyl hydrolase, partial [Planctomycetota bacterium]